MQEFTAAERRLLEQEATDLFQRAASDGGLEEPPKDDEQVRPAFDLLVDLGLLQHDQTLDRFVAVDPASVQGRVVGPLGQRGAELLSEASQWAQALDGLSRSFRRAATTDQPLTELHGFANINRFLESALDDATSELLTAQPNVGRNAAVFAEASQRDIRTITRGVSMRTLYQHSARRMVAAQEYVARVSAHGAQVRTLDEFFNRLIVVDRIVAVIPGAEGTHVAIAVREPSLVAYLVDLFERNWERAQPFDDHANETTATIAADVRNMTIRMLSEGHSDPVSAKRMGVSTRTYAGYIASLKEEFSSQTRFQLGYAMGLDDAKTTGDGSF